MKKISLLSIFSILLFVYLIYLIYLIYNCYCFYDYYELQRVPRRRKRVRILDPKTREIHIAPPSQKNWPAWCDCVADHIGRGNDTKTAKDKCQFYFPIDSVESNEPCECCSDYL